MRLLVFCGAGAAPELRDRFPDLLDLPATASHSDRADVLDAFEADEGAILATGPHMTYGWRAPRGTLVLFAPDFPNDRALRAQAAARPAR